MTDPQYTHLISSGTGSVQVRGDALTRRVRVSAWTSYDDTAELSPDAAREAARHLLAAADVAEGKPLCCAARAEPLEPTFTLLGRDLAACTAVSQWAQARLDLGLNDFGDEQIQSALALSNEMEAYAQQRKARTEDTP